MGIDPLLGKVINNYRILAEINRGAFGSVYKAEHLYLKHRLVAIKFLHTHLPVEKEREQFAHEAQILSDLKHPQILSLNDFGFSENRSYMIADYAPGGSLRHLLLRQSPLPITQALTIIEQVGQALSYAHSNNVIHRDLKPENILFDAQQKVLLADFGIATILSASVKQSVIAGTPSHMAPEHFQGMVSKEGDQYALGCITYELVTGHLPFEAPDFFSLGYQYQHALPVPPSQLNAQVKPSIEAAILKALSKQRTERYPSIEAFVLALRGRFTQSFPSPNAQQPLAPTYPATASPGGTKEEWSKVREAHYQAERYQESLAAYNQIIRLDPNDADAY